VCPACHSLQPVKLLQSASQEIWQQRLHLDQAVNLGMRAGETDSNGFFDRFGKAYRAKLPNGFLS
jgi:hypothetical protein